MLQEVTHEDFINFLSCREFIYTPRTANSKLNEFKDLLSSTSFYLTHSEYTASSFPDVHQNLLTINFIEDQSVNINPFHYKPTDYPVEFFYILNSLVSYLLDKNYLELPNSETSNNKYIFKFPLDSAEAFLVSACIYCVLYNKKDTKRFPNDFFNKMNDFYNSNYNAYHEKYNIDLTHDDFTIMLNNVLGQNFFDQLHSFTNKYARTEQQFSFLRHSIGIFRCFTPSEAFPFDINTFDHLSLLLSVYTDNLNAIISKSDLTDSEKYQILYNSPKYLTPVKEKALTDDFLKKLNNSINEYNTYVKKSIHINPTDTNKYLSVPSNFKDELGRLNTEILECINKYRNDLKNFFHALSNDLTKETNATIVPSHHEKLFEFVGNIKKTLIKNMEVLEKRIHHLSSHDYVKTMQSTSLTDIPYLIPVTKCSELPGTIQYTQSGELPCYFELSHNVVYSVEEILSIFRNHLFPYTVSSLLASQRSYTLYEIVQILVSDKSYMK